MSINFHPIKPLTGKDAPVTRHIKLHGRRSWKDGVDFTINDKMHLHDQPVKSDELQAWEIINPSMLDHPFHLHGFFFQVLEVNSEEPEYKPGKIHSIFRAEVRLRSPGCRMTGQGIGFITVISLSMTRPE